MSPQYSSVAEVKILEASTFNSFSIIDKSEVLNISIPVLINEETLYKNPRISEMEEVQYQSLVMNNYQVLSTRKHKTAKVKI